MPLSLRSTAGWCAGLCSLLCALHAAAAPASVARHDPGVDIPIADIPYTKFVLKNGLTVIVHEDHKTPVVAVNTWYHVGSKNEKPGKTGFAHLFEHLMFSGSAHFDKTFLSALEGIGAKDLNGTTNKDRTNYFETVPTSMLDYALFAESDRMGHLLGVLDQKKLDLQRGVVQNEKRQRENQPYGIVDQIVTENTWPANHPYSWTVIGSMADLDAASMTDVTEWFKGHYGPNNVVLVLAGDITPQQAREKVEKYYGDIPPGPPQAHQQAWVAKRSGTHRGRVEDRVPQARLYRLWNVPGADTPEEPLLDLAAQVLGGDKTSRLYQRLVVREQLATGVGSGNESNEIAGQFGINLTAKPGAPAADVARMEALADEELRALMKSGPTAAELRLAQTAILAQHARAVERVGGFGGKSDVLARCATFTSNPDCYKLYLQRIKDATPAAVRQAMADWLADGDYVLQVDPFPTGLAAQASTLDRSKGPPAGHPEPLTLPPMQKTTLSNGLAVVLAERHGAPVINLSLMFGGGFASDAHALPGLASFTLRMLEEGTGGPGAKTRDTLQISQELEALGASFGTTINLDGAFVNMNVLKPTLAQALDLYADLALHPSFPQDDVERVRKTRLAAIQREETVPRLMALRVLPPLLYGQGHPYALPLTGTGTQDAVAKMTRADLVAYHGTWFRPNNATLLVVGDTTLAELKPLLERAFGAWRPGTVPAHDAAQVAQPAGTTIYLIDRPGALQSDIVGAQLAPPRNTPDAVALNLLNDVFGGTFSSRLNMALREDKHWSYGVGSSLVAARGQRILYSDSPVQTDKTADALQELARQYAALGGTRPVSARELQDAQANETLGLPGSFETVSQLSNAYATILQYGLPEDYYNTYTATALALTPAQLNALAARVVLPRQPVWIVVGDMSRIEAPIRALNLGTVRRIDVEGRPLP